MREKRSLFEALENHHIYQTPCLLNKNNWNRNCSSLSISRLSPSLWHHLTHYTSNVVSNYHTFPLIMAQFLNRSGFSYEGSVYYNPMSGMTKESMMLNNPGPSICYFGATVELMILHVPGCKWSKWIILNKCRQLNLVIAMISMHLKKAKERQQLKIWVLQIWVLHGLSYHRLGWGVVRWLTFRKYYFKFNAVWRKISFSSFLLFFNYEQFC